MTMAQSYNGTQTTNGPFSSGQQDFYDGSTLNAVAENSVSGGSQFFYNSSTLNAAGEKAVTDGTQKFFDNSVLNASAAQAMAGLARISFYDSSVFNVSVANGLDGASSLIEFSEDSTLNALASGAIGQANIRLYDRAALNVLANDALSASTLVQFYLYSSPDAGALRLNGYSTTVGSLKSVGLGGVVENTALNNSMLTVDSSVLGDSSFNGSIRDGGAGTLSLTKSGEGTLFLGGTNTYNGGTIINGGILSARAPQALPQYTSYTINNGTLDLNNYELTMSSLSGAGGNVALGTAALTVAQSTNTTYGGVIDGKGSLTKNGLGVLTLTGVSTYSGGTTIDAGTLQLGDGGTTGSVAGDVLNNGTLVFKRSNELTFAGSISGAGSVEQIGTGVTILNGANIHSGDTQVLAGVLRAGATHTFSPLSQTTLSTDGTLDLNGFDQTVAGLSNAGSVLLNGAPGTVLTVSGTYTSNGGNLFMNTVLGADDSMTDHLVANSVVMRNSATIIFVQNIGGLGGLTTGNGIELVTVTGGMAESAPDAFRLGNRVAASAYDYRLYQGGLGDSSDNGNWYLRSSLDCSLDSTVPACALGGDQAPLYRPEVFVNSTIPALASRFGLGMLGTWRDRTGNEATPPQGGGHGNRVWGRLIGETGTRRFDGDSVTGQLASRGPSYDYSFSGFQTGADLLRQRNAAGDFAVGGLYIGAGTARAKAFSPVDLGPGKKAGTVTMDGYTMGAYYTYRGAQGWYLDAVAQGTRYSRTRATSNSSEPQSLSTNGLGSVASLEAGYSIDLGGSWNFEPQGQLIYQRISFDKSKDRFGLISFNDSDAIYGRLGGRLSKQITVADDKPLTVWLRGDLLSAFGARAKTTFTDLDGTNPAIFKTELGGNWIRLGGGVSGELSKRTSLSVSLDYEMPISPDSGHSIAGHVGVKIAW